MNRKNVISSFIISIFLLCLTTAISAEEKNWYKSLIKLFQREKTTNAGQNRRGNSEPIKLKDNNQRHWVNLRHGL